MGSMNPPNTSAAQSVLGGSSSIIVGNQEDRPAAGTEGRLFIPLDGYHKSYDNGTSWYPLIRNYKNLVVPPTISELGYYGSGSGLSIVDDHDGLLMTYQPTLTDTLNCIALTELPSPPYYFTIGIELRHMGSHRYSWVGITLTESSSGAGRHAHWLMKNFITNDLKCTNPYNSALNTFYTDNNLIQCQQPPWTTGYIFLQIYDDGTNRHYRFSGDNSCFTTFISMSRTDYLTPTHCGIIIGGSDDTYPDAGIVARVFHWLLESSS